MINTGAMVNVMSTELAKYLNLVKEDASNLKDSPFQIKGMGDKAHGTAILETEV